MLMLHHHHQPSVHVATAPYVSKSPSSTAVIVCHSVVSLPLYGKNTLDVNGLDWSNKLANFSLALLIVQLVVLEKGISKHERAKASCF